MRTRRSWRNQEKLWKELGREGPRPLSLLTLLKSTLRALEAHLDDECKRLGITRAELCPCGLEEVAEARAAIARLERVS